MQGLPFFFILFPISIYKVHLHHLILIFHRPFPLTSPQLILSNLQQDPLNHLLHHQPCQLNTSILPIPTLFTLTLSLTLSLTVLLLPLPTLWLLPNLLVQPHQPIEHPLLKWIKTPLDRYWLLSLLRNLHHPSLLIIIVLYNWRLVTDVCIRL